jgi:molybdenum cofactor sulfurtransferase
VLAPVTEKELCFHSHDLHKLLRRQAGRNISNGGLFVFPAQSNLSGIKHSVSWVVEAQQNGWHVCVDATTVLPTSALDLEIHQPDFVVGSFHHMVGYPSGMGFLLVRRESFCVRASPSGTLQFLRNQPAEEGEHCHIMCPADNTMNLLQFAAVNLGLVQLERIGLAAIQKRTRALAQWLLQRLRTLRHKDDDSRYLLRVYGSHAMKDRGSIVSFNVIDMSGTVLPPDIVRKLAARCNIKLSVGNFNNPGLANLLGGRPHERTHDVGIIEKNWGFMAVRASFGAVSTFSDVYRLVQFLSRFRDEEYLASEAMGFVEERNQQER